MALNTPIRDWTGKRVWVIGASQGIGEALALALIERKARVVLSARNRERLEEISRAGKAGDTLILPMDVTRPDTITAAWSSLRTQWGGVDVVLIVAGTHRAVRAWELRHGVARTLVETNLMGAFNVLEVVVPALLDQGRGGVGVVSSVAGYRGLPTALVYGATKAAVINLAETLYLDLKPRGLDVYLVNPGFVKTPLTDRNEFVMPALISAQEAAEHTLRGLQRGAFEIHYPLRFTLAMKVLRMLPYGLYFRVVRAFTGL